MTPLLFLHGALGSTAQFSLVRAQLPPDWPVFAINLPGHGGLPVDAPFSMRLFTQAVVQFLDENRIPEVQIFGYSMGGYVALQVAAEHPERIRQVVILGTKLAWTPEVAAGMSRMFDPVKIEAKAPHFAEVLAQTHAPADWKLVCTYTSSFLHDLGNGHGLTQETLLQIACPVTIGWGTADNVVSEAESRAAAAQIPHGNFVALETVQHPIEQVPTAVLADFIKEYMTQH